MRGWVNLRHRRFIVKGYNADMALLSGSEQDWNERAKLSNYRCRDCRELITFADQESYFRHGLCAPCLEARDEERRTSSDPRKRLEDIRSRGPRRK